MKRLCRYCNTPTEETDNTNFKFSHNNCKQINCLIDAATKSTSNTKQQEAKDRLKNMSLHAVENAWDNVNFCDPRRGIFGATPGEVMHCLQHGLFMYLFKGIFHQRKLNKQGRKRLLITATSSKNNPKSNKKSKKTIW